MATCASAPLARATSGSRTAGSRRSASGRLALAPEAAPQRPARERVLGQRLVHLVGRGVLLQAERSVQCVHREHIAVRLVALRRAGAAPASVAEAVLDLDRPAWHAAFPD